MKRRACSGLVGAVACVSSALPTLDTLVHEAVASWQEMKSEYEARMNKEREDTRVRYEPLNLLVYAA